MGRNVYSDNELWKAEKNKEKITGKEGQERKDLYGFEGEH